MRRAQRLLMSCGVVLMASLAGGCATHTRTVQTEETYQAPATARESASAPQQRTVVKKTTTTDVQRHERSPHGVLSGVVHLVGEVLSLPFRLIASHTTSCRPAAGPRKK